MDAADTSSSFSRLLLNLWIGLCRPCVGLPQDFYLLGFRCQCIEHQFHNQRRELVQPELLIASAECHHAVSFEWKNGRNLVDDQLNRYQGLSPADLIREAYLRAVETTTQEVVIIGREEHEDALKLGLANGSYRFALLVVTEEGLKLVANDFVKAELSDLFKPTYLLDWSRVPTEFIRVMGDSPDWEIAEAIVPAMLARATRGAVRFEIDDLCRDVSEHWPIMGNPGKDGIRSKVRDVLRMGVNGQLSGFFGLENNTIRPSTQLRSPDLKRRSETLKGLRSAQTRFIESLRAGTQQMALFPTSALE